VCHSKFSAAPQKLGASALAYLQNDNDQNLTGNNSYRLNDRLNSASVEQHYQPHQLEEFQASAIDEEMLKLNIAAVDLSWTSQNQSGVEIENEDLLTTIEMLGWEIDRNNGAAITNGQLKKLKKMQGGWFTLPFYGLADRAVVKAPRFKPIVPPIGTNGKPSKYLGAVGGANRGYLPNISDRLWRSIGQRLGVEKTGASYGEWLLNNPTIPALIPEGEKKTLSSTCAGYPAVGINGCDGGYISIANEDSSHQRLELIPDLAALAAGGRDIYLALDRDSSRKTENRVSQSRKKLARLLYQAGAGRVFSLQWDAKKAKGLDDFIRAEGVAGLSEAIEKAYEIPQSKNKSETDRKKSMPSALEMAEAMVDGAIKDIRYDASTKQWWRYDGAGKWLPSSDEYIFGVAQKYLREVLPDFTPSYVRNCLEFARTHLLYESWTEASSLMYLPFKNGVLDLATNQLLPHSPDYGFKWQLPRDYAVRAGDWRKINEFLNSLCGGNQELKGIAISFCNAVVKGRSDLQKFLYLFGSGANGKGAFMSLLGMLIGKENTHASSMGDLNGNRFESANLQGKRLLLMTDEDKRIGGVGVFKAATGGDPIRFERKGKDATNFVFKGMAVVAANTPTFVGDSSYAIKRRKIDFPCLARISEHDRRDLTAEFEGDLTAFTTYLLSIPDEWVTATIRNASSVEAVRRMNWEMTIREDSIAAFYSERLILDPNGSIASGLLYKNYQEFCEEQGLKSKSLPNFTPSLKELVNDSLGHSIAKRCLEQVGTKRTSSGIKVVGLRLKQEWETGEGCRVVQGDVGASVGLKPLPSIDNVGYVGNSNSWEKSVDNNLDVNKLPAPEKTDITGKEIDHVEEKCDHPTQPTQSAVDQDLKPTQPHTQGCTTLHKFKVGDRVTNEKVGRTGTIVEIRTRKTPKGTEYVQYRVDFGFDSCWFEDVVLQAHKTAV
jgi:P4 family phage/plasmid primase-like protien